MRQKKNAWIIAVTIMILLLPSNAEFSSTPPTEQHYCMACATQQILESTPPHSLVFSVFISVLCPWCPPSPVPESVNHLDGARWTDANREPRTGRAVGPVRTPLGRHTDDKAMLLRERSFCLTRLVMESLSKG